MYESGTAVRRRQKDKILAYSTETSRNAGLIQRAPTLNLFGRSPEDVGELAVRPNSRKID